MSSRTSPTPAAPQTASFSLFPRLIARASTHPMAWLEGLACPKAARLLEEAVALEEERFKPRAQALERALYEEIPRLSDELRSKALNLKRALHDAPCAAPPAGCAPVKERLPEAARRAWEELEALRVRREALLGEAERSFEAEYEAARLCLREVLREPLVQEGILLSSRKLYEGVRRYLAKPPEPGERGSKAQRQLERSAVEHLARACAKTTPRGLLTGVGLGRWDEGLEEGVALVAREGGPIVKRRTLLTLPVARRLAEEVSRELWKEVAPRPNPTWHEEGGKIHFWKFEDEKRGETLYSLGKSAVLEAFLEEAEGRTLKARELIARVGRRLAGEYEDGELEGYYRKLCEKGLLIGHLEIPFERQDGLGSVIEWLEGLGPLCPRERLEGLVELRGLLRQIDEKPGGLLRRIALYEEASRRIHGLLSAKDDMGFQACAATDCVVSPHGLRLGPGLRDDLRRALEVSYFLAAAAKSVYHSGRSARITLDSFALPEEQETPLHRLWAAAPRPKPSRENGPKPQGPRPGSFVAAVVDWLAGHIGGGAGPGPKRLDVEQDGLLRLFPRLALEAGFGSGFAEFQIAARSAQAIREGDYLLVLDGLPNSLVPAYARHVELLQDDALGELLGEHMRWLRTKASADKLWADILLMPFSNTDAAICHPQFQQHVVELFWSRAERAAVRIPLRELWLRRDEAAKSLELIWKKGDGERAVHPSYLSPVDTATSPLAQVVKQLGWAQAPSLLSWVRKRFYGAHLPRLTLGRVVLHRETWTTRKGELPASRSESPWGSFAVWDAWRRARGMPRHVFARAGAARPFWTDFCDPFSLDILEAAVSALAPEDEVQFQEMLPAPDQLWNEEAGGRLATQLRVGFQWE